MKAAPWAALARAIYGLTLLAAPDALLHRLSRHEADEITRVLTRLLGARLLIQTALIPPNSSPRRLRVGATIDTSHALTLIILATRSRKWRRLAITNAVATIPLATTGYLQANRNQRI